VLPSHFAPVRGSGSGFVRVRLGFVCWAGLGWGICTGFGLSVSAGAGVVCLSVCLSADLRRAAGVSSPGVSSPPCRGSSAGKVHPRCGYNSVTK